MKRFTVTGGSARRILLTTAALMLLLGVAGPVSSLRGQEKTDGGTSGFKFKSGVDLVNVTITVNDTGGRYVGTLRQEDFQILEDGEPQTISHFSSERVPVSLGIAVDTSGSMAGEKIVSARSALDRFLLDLLGPDDEVFLYRFSERPDLVESWTTDRRRLSRALAGLMPHGGTALYDTVAEGVPLAQSGQNLKKAFLLITDGNDTNSQTSVRSVKQLVRDSEVLVYAVGIDGRSEPTFTQGGSTPPIGRPPISIPFPVPGGGRRPLPGYPPPQPGGGRGGGSTWGRVDDRVNVNALRELTDDSGGRTEIVRSARDIDPATASIADELSRQYYAAYSSTRPRDGRWHTIEVKVRGGQYRVRARRGYMATP